MKSKDYQKPTMRVVKLRHRSNILVGSPENVKASMNDEFLDQEVIN